jgi:predicted transcriptional regulator
MGNSITVTVANRRVKLKNLVAEGGYGYIYRAEEEGTKKQLALKMMRVPCDKNGTVVSAEVGIRFTPVSMLSWGARK